MKRPYMPLYIADYLSATEHLDAAHSGAYLHLIMHYWQKGFLPEEDKFLARIARMTDRQWLVAKPTIKAFFRDDWTHERIENEIAHAEKKAEARAMAGQHGGIAKALKVKNTTIAKATAELGETASKTPSKPLPSSSGLELEEEPSGSSNSCPSGRELAAKADEFYDAYPKKVDPRDAKARFVRIAKSGVDPDRMLAAARRYAEAHRLARTEKHFIPAPAVWLNRGGYDSEDLPEPRAGPSIGINGTRNGKMSIQDAARKALEKFQQNPDGNLFAGDGDEVRPSPIRLLSAR